MKVASASELKPEKSFLLLASIFGLLFLTLIPPFQVPDEAYHFFRAYQVSEGKWIGEKRNGVSGAEVPRSLVSFQAGFAHIPLFPAVKTSTAEVLKFKELPLRAQEVLFVPFLTPFSYSPLTYLPQGGGVLLGRLLKLSPFYLLYLGRLMNLAAWLALTFLTIRLTPILKWVFALLALTPMALQQAASLSPDAMTNGLAFLFIAAILHWSLTGEKKLALKKLYPSALLSIPISLAKLVYVFHSVLLFLIPARRFLSKRKGMATLAGIVMLNFLSIFLWLKIGEVPAAPAVQSQVRSLLETPAAYPMNLAKTLVVSGPQYLEHFIGRLGHLDTALPKFLVVYYWILLLVVALKDREMGPGLSARQKLLIGLCLLAEVLAILTGQLLTWKFTEVGTIGGVQGRYFIPVAPLFFLLLYRRAKPGFPASKPWIGWISVYSVLMSSILSLFFLMRRFYR